MNNDNSSPSPADEGRGATAAGRGTPSPATDTTRLAVVASSSRWHPQAELLLAAGLGGVGVLAWQHLPGTPGAALAVAALLLLGGLLRRRWHAGAATGQDTSPRTTPPGPAPGTPPARPSDPPPDAERLAGVGCFDWQLPRGPLHWSAGLYHLLGLSPDEHRPSIGLLMQHLHPDDHAHVERHARRVLSEGGLYDSRHRLRAADGRVRHVHALGQVVLDAAGRPCRMVGAVLDVTDRVQTEATLRLYQFALDAMSDSVSVMDAEHRYRLVNAAWLASSGRRADQAVGHSLQQVFPVVVSPERRQALVAAINEDRVSTVRGPSPGERSRNRQLETRYFPFHDPEVQWRGAVMVSRDVTDDEAVQKALNDSLANLRLTLDTIGDAIFATSASTPDEPVLFANDQLHRLFDIPLDVPVLSARVIVRHASRWFHDVAHEQRRIDTTIAAATRTGQRQEDRLELTDGRVLARRCIPTERDGRAMRVWTFRDVTAEQHAQQLLSRSEDRLRRLLEAFPGFIWGFDEHLRVAYLNPASAAVYQPLTQLEGRPASDVLGHAVMQRLGPALQRVLAGETLSLDWHRKSRSGRSPDDLLLKLAPGTGPDGRPMVYGFGIDISSLKAAETALVAAKEEAERANRAKTQFLSSMSHELRTPLNAIIGFSQVLEQNGDRRLGDRQLRHVAEIQRAGRHLLALINDLLDLSRIEAGRTELDVASVPLHGLLHDCLQLLQPLAARRPCRLQPPPPGQWHVKADAMRLKQVLLNLLSNAIKYNRPGGEVGLLVHVQADGVLLEVHDQGPGLTADDQTRLFQPFERLHAKTSDTEGSGIGLALSRQLVELMKGRIGVRSQPGQGSVFWVQLPRADALPALALAGPAPAAPGPAPEARHQPAARVVYIDDNPVNLALMEGLFDGEPGLRLSTQRCSETALAQMQQDPPDLALVDLQMPGLDGFELATRLRQHAATAALPLVAVTADVTAQSRQRCQALGFAGYVTKPVDATLLMQSVRAALQPAR